jgi:ferredoxin
VRVIVDLTRCQGYGQCAFLAPDVFAMNGDEALLYDTDADEAQREHVLRAAAACPVQAIHLDQMATQHRGMRTGVVVSAPAGDGFRKTGRIVIVGASLAGARAGTGCSPCSAIRS